MDEFNIGYYDSPIGRIKIMAKNDKIISVGFKFNEEKENPNDVIYQCKKELDEYFNGKRKSFDVEIEYLNGTEFQKKVWNSLMEIPYGETASYKDIAHNIDNPKAVRAVGGANNKNNIAIIVPCHRVIGSNGKLIGYEWGLEIKKYLLELECKYK